MFLRIPKDTFGTDLWLWKNLSYIYIKRRVRGSKIHTTTSNSPLPPPTWQKQRDVWNERNHMGLWLKWREGPPVWGVPLYFGLPCDNVCQPQGCVWSAVSKELFKPWDKKHADSGVGGKETDVCAFGVTSKFETQGAIDLKTTRNTNLGSTGRR
jgi:hypothetical protein